MREILLLLGFTIPLSMASVIFHISAVNKSRIIAIFSTIFLFILTESIAHVGLIIFWVLAVLWIPWQKNLKIYVSLYSVSAVVLFLYFKLGFNGYTIAAPLLNYSVPVGLSVIFFRSISWILLKDVNGRSRSLEFFGNFLFFPTLMVGPFAKYQQLARPLNDSNSALNIFSGISLVAYGLVKFSVSGLVLVSLLHTLPISLFSLSQSYHVATILFLGSFFVYCNFSGFSDLATGAANMLGFQPGRNFIFPFLAKSPADFWNRWHISLGSWFREYIFYPLQYGLVKRNWPILSGPRGSLATSSVITFLFIGFWHEVSWKMLVWSLINGIAVIYIVPRPRHPLPGIVLTFFFSCFINLMFLSSSLSDFFQFWLSLPKLQIFYWTLADTILVGCGAFLLAWFYVFEAWHAKFSENARIGLFFSGSIFLLIHIVAVLLLGFQWHQNVYLGY